MRSQPKYRKRFTDQQALAFVKYALDDSRKSRIHIEPWKAGAETNGFRRLTHKPACGLQLMTKANFGRHKEKCETCSVAWVAGNIVHA